MLRRHIFFVVVLQKELWANADSCLSLACPGFPAVSRESVSHSPTAVWQGSTGSRRPLLTRVQPSLVGFSVSLPCPHLPNPPRRSRLLSSRPNRQESGRKLGHPVDDINNSSSLPQPFFFLWRNDPDLYCLTGPVCVRVCVCVNKECVWAVKNGWDHAVSDSRLWVHLDQN